MTRRWMHSPQREGLRDKIQGGKQALQDVTDNRSQVCEIVTSDLMQEVTLKQYQFLFAGIAARCRLTPVIGFVRK